MFPAHPDGAAIRALFLADEAQCIARLLPEATYDAQAAARVQANAREWVRGVRQHHAAKAGIESFLHQYDLSTDEGVLLMCVAEALLRIPDAATADRLIRDKLSRGDWERHLGRDASLLVNASTWGLMLTGKLTRMDAAFARDPVTWYERVIARAGEPLVRVALRQAMKVMAEQFVMGRTIDEALTRSRHRDHAQSRHSFDMLGESAITAADAMRYRHSYAAAIQAISDSAKGGQDIFAQPSISLKLSALHPRYEAAQAPRVLAELVPVVTTLAHLAMRGGIGMTVDAEEAERLELSLEIFAAVRRDASLAAWHGLGLAVQAYQKRAIAVIDWLVALAADADTRIPVRLVKGAYWDTEIKRAQVLGLTTYPVFTRKAHTDVSYLACAKRMLEATRVLYPMFATHNAHTAAAIVERASELGVPRSGFEFQRLHGMGEALYQQMVSSQRQDVACRVYAPVGSHEDLLPYLVRRLLENGANTSFVNRIADASLDIEDIVADPAARVAAQGATPNPSLPLPSALFAPMRVNSQGFTLADQTSMAIIDDTFSRYATTRWSAAPLIGGECMVGDGRDVSDPADHRRIIGSVVDASAAHIDLAFRIAKAAQVAWDASGGETRADILDRVASLLEAARGELVVLLAREAGKTRADAIGEVREAADYCRYYATLARKHFSRPLTMPSPTGETNELSLRGRGVFICISPWNFPLAIFVGQVAGALAAGNAVIAKPAEQTSIIAFRTVQMMLDAGVPSGALALLPGTGEAVGAALVDDERLAGVAFTGSTTVANAIARSLAQRRAIPAFIAETGGQNALIADSSALPEQVVIDAVNSAFNSAGQRCSALRVLYVQHDIAPRVLDLLRGAMDQLAIGDPALVATDVGPVIDLGAREALEQHVTAMIAAGTVLHRAVLPGHTRHGTFVAPTLVELDGIDRLQQEIFGPVLHVVRYAADALDTVIDAINATGYGLTLGIHSRIDETVRHIAARARVGNIYVNRNMIGATVGMQPFGGEGLSGTGPKAGGPHYLFRFAVERTLSINTAAAGGNATLLALGDG